MISWSECSNAFPPPKPTHATHPCCPQCTPVYVCVCVCVCARARVQERKAAIWRDVEAAAHGAGGVVPDGCRGDLLDEVSNLVESPTVVLGSFGEEFLRLPR